MKLKDKLNLVNIHRRQLTDSERKTLSSYKQMIRNIKEESGRIGGETHVSPNGLKHAEAWADNTIAIYSLADSQKAVGYELAQAVLNQAGDGLDRTDFILSKATEYIAFENES